MQGQSSQRNPEPVDADSVSLSRLFLEARSIQRFRDVAISDETLARAHALARLGPTGFNSQPVRYVFVRSLQAKLRLGAALSEKNREKLLGAPLSVIIAWDSRFYEHLPRVFPTRDVRALFEQNPALVQSSGKLNATLQAGYFLVALRAVGLDVGPMTGFKQELVDAEFFADGRFNTLLLANLGYGDRSGLAERLPRFEFDEVARID
ncbi:MAG: malonic semialdehyde reductase [Polyangiaceae bacterium]